MINFLKYTKFYVLISLLVIASGLFSVFHWGYRVSIDFTGGTDLEYQTSTVVAVDQVKTVLQRHQIEAVTVEQRQKIVTLRVPAISDTQETTLRSDLAKQLNTKITLLRAETVGPTLGSETMKKTLVACALAIAGILLYMSFAFKNFNFALAAVLAMFHDFLVVVGSYSLLSHFFGAQVDTLFVTAVLTTMSFSVHDTIIIFDKIREYHRNEGKGDLINYANRALTETMVRSLNNSMTIIFMLLALTLLGGSLIRFFAATLLIGTITGTYSSPFVATPILVWLEGRKK
ncbi:protein translocase subunit SecF [Patescibacteria group bacterium]|nr:protein translocase subunit SecF [Patescibacteria group bacterium]MCL5091632.1 protein translocase subunit SecF [Patescibacteria group bacterium]